MRGGETPTGGFGGGEDPILSQIDDAIADAEQTVELPGVGSEGAATLASPTPDSQFSTLSKITAAARRHQALVSGDAPEVGDVEIKGGLL